MKDFSTRIPSNIENLTEAMTFIDNKLSECKLNRKDKAKALLLTEEYLVEFFKNIPHDERIIIKVKKILGKTTITILGKSSSAIDTLNPESHINFDAYESAPNAEAAIRGMIFNANRDILSQSFRNKTNKVVITAGVSSQKNLMNVLFSMLCALVICACLRIFFPESVTSAINDYVFMTIKTIFLNALKTIVAPLIFFSIAASVSSISDLSEFGRIGVKVMTFYLTTTLVATIVSLTAYNIISPGSFNELAYMIKGAEAVESQQMVSILDTLIDIVPSNFFGAFVNSATLQLIFLGILIGGVVPLMGDKTEKIASFLSTANELFLTVATTITKCMPIAVFAFIGSMVLMLDVQVLKTLVTLFICIFTAMIMMFLFYLLAVLVTTKSNPFDFFQRAVPAWLNAFALSSSNAAMTFTMNTCDKKLNISPKLYSFSIPLGATINMDGFVIVLTIAFLFLAKVFGVALSSGELVTLIITIVLLSFGAPGMPGVGTICMSVLLLQFNVPMEALALFIGINAITDPFGTANNVFGDIVGSYCVAKRNGMMQDNSNNREQKN